MMKWSVMLETHGALMVRGQRGTLTVRGQTGTLTIRGQRGTLTIRGQRGTLTIRGQLGKQGKEMNKVLLEVCAISYRVHTFCSYVATAMHSIYCMY